RVREHGSFHRSSRGVSRTRRVRAWEGAQSCARNMPILSGFRAGTSTPVVPSAISADYRSAGNSPPLRIGALVSRSSPLGLRDL
ncbi:MAG: hypothetical protein NZL87_09465, partial [Thermomicrobium sp.]|nr:hypothetical protein [Thermomicrobium sp.]